MTGIINNKTKNKYKSLWNNLFFYKRIIYISTLIEHFMIIKREILSLFGKSFNIYQLYKST